MNRRAFLSLFSAGAAGMVLDPERLLWVPGQRTFFLPSIVEPPTELLLTPDWITREALRILSKNLNLTSMVNRTYDADYGAGYTVSARLPQRFGVAA